MLDEIWDYICEGFGYIFSGEVFGDIAEFFSGMFENMGDFSIGGAVFGLCGFGLIFMLRDYMLSPFLLHMGALEALFWGIATYITTFVTGYLVGKRLFDSD